ncbi:MAG: hypothetical protein OXB88_10500 [Bacteriovoracales bacterium]|nr:hypothetical protein [Bacteriovoracales bacterium]
MNVKKLSLCAGFVLAVLNMPYSRASTVDDCWSQWNGSSAAATCSGGSKGADCGTTTMKLLTFADPVTQEKIYKCAITTKCAKGGGVSISLANLYCDTSSEDAFWSDESIEGFMARIGYLSNCDGSLTYGSCS